MSAVETIPAFTYQLNTDGATKEVTTYGECEYKTVSDDRLNAAVNFRMLFFMGYTDFFHFAAPEYCIYDMYSRDAPMGYKVFVGEYSANVNSFK